jgi:hypothetical protein
MLKLGFVFASRKVVCNDIEDWKKDTTKQQAW